MERRDKKNPRGSEWRKWDLQVQPVKQEWFRNLSGFKDHITRVTREYLTKAVSNELGVVAITDHNCGAAIDAALEIVSRDDLPIAVLPGVEIDTQEGFQLLVILNPQYLRRVQKSSWYDAVQHLLNHVGQLESPVFNEHGCAESIKIPTQEFLERLFIEDIGLPIFAHVHAAKGLFQQSTPANRQRFFANYKSGKYVFALDHKDDSQIEATKKTLSGWGYDPRQFAFVKTSDAHGPADVGATYAWIKAECTYEGLKQIIYDPASRLSTLTIEPVKPTNTITSITFNVPKTAKLKVERGREERFCFAGVVGTYELSPYFNCVIGGRGSGKSTVLNFLGRHSTNAASSLAFWERLHPSFDTVDKNLFALGGVEVFEFIGQSEVESFATDKKAFTQAIYQRAEMQSDGALARCDAELSARINALKLYQGLVRNVEELRAQYEVNAREKRTLEGSLKMINSQEYRDIVDQITAKSGDRQKLETWRVAVGRLRDSIKNLHMPDLTSMDVAVARDLEAPGTIDVAQQYIHSFLRARQHLEEAAGILAIENFKALEDAEGALLAEIALSERKLSELLKGAGLSEENIQQVKSAPQRLVRIDVELEQLRKSVEEKETELGNYDAALDTAREVRIKYEEALDAAIQPLVRVLEDQAKENQKRDIKNIGLSYFFDVDAAWSDLAAEVYATFSPRFGNIDRSDLLKSYICEHGEIFSLGRTEIVGLLAKVDKSAAYVRFLRDVFGTEASFQVFRVIRDRHLHDVSKYKRIQVLYDGNDIERASFGQKCTAVIVILLLFGNYPLIIDEPEAHLDSSLIANYLVPLIKTKKPNRQLIFSTHNANFVVNGDAEKIFVLKNETGTTQILETTIEDLGQREELLKLEGGREAFKKRGEKLDI